MKMGSRRYLWHLTIPISRSVPPDTHIPWFLSTFLISADTPGYMLTPKDLGLGTSNKTKQVALDLLGVDFLPQQIIFQSYLFSYTMHDLILYYSQVEIYSSALFGNFPKPKPIQAILILLGIVCILQTSYQPEQIKTFVPSTCLLSYH